MLGIPLDELRSSAETDAATCIYGTSKRVSKHVTNNLTSTELFEYSHHYTIVLQDKLQTFSRRSLRFLRHAVWQMWPLQHLQHLSCGIHHAFTSRAWIWVAVAPCHLSDIEAVAPTVHTEPPRSSCPKISPAVLQVSTVLVPISFITSS